MAVCITYIYNKKISKFKKKIGDVDLYKIVSFKKNQQSLKIVNNHNT